MKTPIRTGLDVGITATLVLATTVDTRSATVHVGRFVYDARTHTLRVPWKNTRPTVKTFHEPRGNVADAEIHGPGKSSFAWKPQAEQPEQDLLGRILQAQNRPGVVRLSIRGRGTPNLNPRLVPQGNSGKGWVLVFDPPPKPVAVVPPPATASVPVGVELPPVVPRRDGLCEQMNGNP